MHIILEGEIEIYVDGSVVGKLFEGQVLGEMALVEDEPRSATAIAKTETKIVPIDRKTFLLIIKEEPLFALFVIKDLSHKIRILSRRSLRPVRQCRLNRGNGRYLTEDQKKLVRRD